jgi:hypothetical protein
VSNEPIMLELADLPREQVGAFLLLGLDKDADAEAIESHWADRVRWARRNQLGVSLEDVNWAREALREITSRLRADAGSLNTDTSDLLLRRLRVRFHLRETGVAWQPLDDERPLAGRVADVVVPEVEEVRAAVTPPEPPRDFPAAALLLEQAAREPLDPWAMEL